jgi:hypothetical protein
MKSPPGAAVKQPNDAFARDEWALYAALIERICLAESSSFIFGGVDA